jgi:hypothetical protein
VCVYAEREFVVEYDVAPELERLRPTLFETLRRNRDAGEKRLTDDQPRRKEDGSGEPKVGGPLAPSHWISLDGDPCIHPRGLGTGGSLDAFGALCNLAGEALPIEVAHAALSSSRTASAQQLGQK